MKSYEIRQLIENYYDIQKIRVETFNRLVSWVKENREKIKEYLKSHLVFETHGRDASQRKVETHVKHASQRIVETQYLSASHQILETHSQGALKLLEEAKKQKGVKGMKKYSEFVKRFVLSHSLLETHEPSASQTEFETQGKHASQTEFETQSHHASLFSEIEVILTSLPTLVHFINPFSSSLSMLEFIKVKFIRDLRKIFLMLSPFSAKIKIERYDGSFIYFN
ncbi:MAG: hypothetical protein QW156_04440 [Candidatus Aenigmatarchaeota archaeon]